MLARMDDVDDAPSAEHTEAALDVLFGIASVVHDKPQD
jgi:hypothetical protein